MIKLFKRRKKPPLGFSMLEVLVAILTITTFLAGTMQLIAVDALFKVKAEREAQANFWIQEDLEEIKAEAAELPEDVSCTSGYASALQTKINTLDSSSSLPGSSNRKIVSKAYNLSRTYTTIAGSPHRLGINYSVTIVGTANDYKNQETVIATSYAEVIPDASFKCD